jgi:hypothetical protein
LESPRPPARCSICWRRRGHPEGVANSGVILDRTGGGFDVLEFFRPPSVVMLLDQPPRLGEVMVRGRVVFRSIIAQAKQPRGCAGEKAQPGAG